jgi:hypothetical protein
MTQMLLVVANGRLDLLGPVIRIPANVFALAGSAHGRELGFAPPEGAMETVECGDDLLPELEFLPVR